MTNYRPHQHLSDDALLQELHQVRDDIEACAPGPVKTRLRAKQQELRKENTMRHYARTMQQRAVRDDQ